MKRPKPKKRRHRKLGMSPYASRHKAPYVYSSAYTTWRSAFKVREKRA